MAGLQGAVLSPGWEGVTGVLDGLSFVEWRTGPGATRLLAVETAAWLAFGLLVVFGLPNSQQLLCRYAPGLDLYGHLAAAEEPRLRWAPTLPWALATGALLVASVLRMMVEGNVEFLYRFF